MSYAKNREINLVSFNVPYPPNYGGVIDVYFKIKALTQLGVKVHLHAFTYGRPVHPSLATLCSSVNYYKRRRLINPVASKLPYIVASRNHPKLLQNLTSNDFPILFDGLHCCYYLDHPTLAGKPKMVRMHNLEHHYYQNLAAAESNVLKRLYFNVEAARLEQFESQLQYADSIASISLTDDQYLQSKFQSSFFVPPFHPNTRITSKPGKGSFALYQGNLAVSENNQAALFLVNEVFKSPIFNFIIAGNNPTKELLKAVSDKPHISIYKNVTTRVIQDLTHAAHINVLPTFQSTGMKLKLLNALFQGKHIVVNKQMVAGSGVEHLVHMANSAEGFRNTIEDLIDLPFIKDEIQYRTTELGNTFSNTRNAQIIAERFFTSIQLV